MLPTADDIVEAAARIKSTAVRTPLLEFPGVNDLLDCRLLVKAENLQRIGAFKFRGAMNALMQVDREAYPGGVVACSSGNHAQGVAEAARLLGMRAAIVMPHDAPAIKVAGVERAGAEIVRYDRRTDDREAMARALAVERQAEDIPPYDDPRIIAGQGTVGLEIALEAKDRGLDLEAVLASCSGGGLISGISLAVHAHFPEAEVMAVEPEGFDDLARSLAAGSHQHNARLAGSICDALLAPTPGRLTFEICKAHLAGSVVVSDADVIAAMQFAFREMKLVVEPGGAAALAAVLKERIARRGRTIGVVLSGGNVDPAFYARTIG